MIFGTTKIDGRYWLVLLPDGGKHRKDAVESQFNKMIRLAGGNAALHTKMATLCENISREHRYADDGACWVECGHVTRYNDNPGNWDLEEPHRRSLGFGFRPVLVPLVSAAGGPDNAYMASFQDGEVIEMGTLYMDGEPLRNPQHPVGCRDKFCPSYRVEADCPEYIDSMELRIGNTHEDQNKRIRLVKVGNCFVSDRVILGCVSYWDLDAHLMLKKYRGAKSLVKDYLTAQR